MMIKRRFILPVYKIFPSWAFVSLILIFITLSCDPPRNETKRDPVKKIRLIFDTDANNELDDQHALAYLLCNGTTFDLEGVTVNTTNNGGQIDEQYAEADRIIRLFELSGQVPLLKGANGSFVSIRDSVNNPFFDGADAVNFIIEKARQDSGEKLLLLMVGKMTNAALAFVKDPSIMEKVRIVWLGSNYPEPGEYNQVNDVEAMNYILNTPVEMEIALVRYGTPTGTDAVRVTLEEVKTRMTGKGPKVKEPVTGRHGGAFYTFGDYSVNLFEHIDYHDDTRSRALFDMAAVAIVKDPTWAESKEIPCPLYINNEWVERPQNTRTIRIWENFNRDNIIRDFYNTLENPQWVSTVKTE